MKICLASSPGGHLSQISQLSSVYNEYDHFFVTIERKDSKDMLKQNRVYFLIDTRRNPIAFLINFFQSLRVFLKEKPDVVITTGAGVALLTCIIAKLFRKKTIFIESFSRVNNPSSFGKLVSPMSDLTIVQWKPLLKHYTKAIYGGPVFDFSGKDDIKKDNYIFVTVGTRPEHFTRLVKTIDNLKNRGLISNRVITQCGHTLYRPEFCDYFDFCSPEEMEDYIKKAMLVITQESAGVVSTCLKYKTPFIIVPRVVAFGELPFETPEDLHYYLEKKGFTHVVKDVNNIPEIIKLQGEKQKKLELNNKKIMDILNEIISKNQIL